MWIKTKLFFNKPIAKRTVYSILVFLIVAVFLVPATFSFIAFNKGNVFAYTRDHSSGTFEAFDEKVLGNDQTEKPQKFSKNVMEVSSNDRMVNDVQINANTVGYISLGTIITLDDKGNFKKDTAYNNISILAFENEFPNEENIKNGDYRPSRNFNQFFRVEKGTSEAEILKIQPKEIEDNSSISNYWDTSNANLIEVKNLSNEEKLSYAYYQWILHSPKAEEIIEINGEISNDGYKWSSTEETKNAQLDLMKILYNEETVNDFSGFDKKIKIEQVGSTSVQAIITDFETILSPILNPYNIYLTHVQNGSGDASKITPPPGTSSPYIGFQSREPQLDGKTFEYSAWGYNNLKDLTDSGAYNSFAIDAIAIIANNNGLTIESDTGSSQINNITQETMRKIYYEGGLSWQELYDFQELYNKSHIDGSSLVIEEE